MAYRRVPAPTRCIAAACAMVGVLAATAASGQAVSTAPRGASLAAAATLSVAPRQARFVYTATGKRLADVLRDFAASQSVPAVLADGIDGVVSASFDITPREFLDAMSKAYGILWYQDGAAYYFYPAKAIQSRLFRLKGYSREQLADLLGSLGLGDARYPLRFNVAQRTLLVYGPPRHVELVASALDSLDLGAAEGNEQVVKVFRLRYASAGDRTLGQTKVPGVVSTLRGLYSGSTWPGDESPRGTSPFIEKMKSLQPPPGAGKLMPDFPTGNGRGTAGDKQEPAAQARGMRSPVNFEDDQPSFEADEGTNSVVVHGRAHRMRDYEVLIRRLDEKPVLVELEARIIDVSTDAVQQLGIDWSASRRGSSVSLVGPDTTPTSPAAGALVGNGFSLSTVLAGAGRQLLARIDALQGEGKARILSKPSILGVANRPAVMKERRIATVRVAGNLEANLFQVEAGTLLQVTPQVTIAADGSPQIKLSLYIEDGSFEASSVDSVPLVKKTEIRTEAHVKEGESLLIGGLVVESDSQLQSQVPFLGSIPLVGALFRSNGNRTTRAERMFMITPRVVGESFAAAPAQAPAPAAPPPFPAPALAPSPSSVSATRPRVSAAPVPLMVAAAMPTTVPLPSPSSPQPSRQAGQRPTVVGGNAVAGSREERMDALVNLLRVR